MFAMSIDNSILFKRKCVKLNINYFLIKQKSIAHKPLFHNEIRRYRHFIINKSIETSQLDRYSLFVQTYPQSN